MKDAANVERFNNDFIGSMKIDFPDIKSLGKEFSYFNERPVVQGTYSLTTSGGSGLAGTFVQNVTLSHAESMPAGLKLRPFHFQAVRNIWCPETVL